MQLTTDGHPSDDLASRVGALVGDDLLALGEEMRSINQERLEQKAHVDHLEHGRKVCLSVLKEQHREEASIRGERVTEARLDDLARSSPEYRKYLQTMKEAQADFGRLEATYWALRYRSDVLIAQLAYARSEHYLVANS